MHKRFTTVPLVAVALFSMLILVTSPFAPYLPNVLAQPQPQPRSQLIPILPSTSEQYVPPLSDPSYQISPQSKENIFTQSDTLVDEFTNIASNMSMRIIPDVKYTVTEQDRIQAERTGLEVYNVKYTSNYSPEAIFEPSASTSPLEPSDSNSEDIFISQMAYFVPYSALSPDELERLKAEGIINPTIPVSSSEKEASITLVQSPAPAPAPDDDLLASLGLGEYGFTAEFAWKASKKIIAEGFQRAVQSMIDRGLTTKISPATIGAASNFISTLRLAWFIKGYMEQIYAADTCIRNALAEGRITEADFEKLRLQALRVTSEVIIVIAIGAMFASWVSGVGVKVAATGNPFGLAVGIGGPMLATAYAFSESNAFLENHLKVHLAPLLKYCEPVKGNAVLCKASYREVPYITRIGYYDDNDKIKPQLQLVGLGTEPPGETDPIPVIPPPSGQQQPPPPPQVQPTPPSEGDTGWGIGWGAPVPLPGETPAEYTARTGIPAFSSDPTSNSGFCPSGFDDGDRYVVIPPPDADVPEAASSTQIPQIGPGGSSSSNLQTGCTPGWKWNQATGKCDLSAFSNLQTGCDPGFKFVNGKCEQLNLPDIPTTKEPKIITKPGGSGGESNNKPDINIDIKPPSGGSNGGSGGGGGDGGAN